MNEKERISEIELRSQIFDKEEELNKAIREGAIKDALLRLEIIRFSSQSQDPEILERGLGHYFLLWEMIKEIKIKYDEIKSSKEEVRSLGNEIAQKLPAPPISNEVAAIEVSSRDLLRINYN